MHIKSSIAIQIILLLASSTAYAQFPFKKGKESTIAIPYINRSTDHAAKTLNFDLSDSRLGFSLIHQDVIGASKPSEDEDQFDDKKVSSWNIGLSLNEKTFGISKGSLDPGFDVDYTMLTIKYNDKKKDTEDSPEMAYGTLVLKPFTEVKNIKNARFGSESQIILDKTTLRGDIGASVGYNWYIDDTSTGLKKVVSLYGAPMFSWNNEEDLEEKNVIEARDLHRNSDGDTVFVEDLDKYYVGELQDKFIFRATIDAGFKIADLKESELKSPSYSSTNLFLLLRASTEYSPVSKPKYNFFVGPSITKYSRQVIASLLFEVHDIGALNDNKEFDDIFKVNLYFGVPIPFK